MKLWYLRPKAGFPPFDANAFGYVVRAETEQEAREFLADLRLPLVTTRDTRWTDPLTTTCVQMDVKNKGDFVELAKNRDVGQTRL
jgi:hypothetical protein